MNVNVIKDNKKKLYPYIAIARETDDLIILFISEDYGIVLNGNDYPIGYTNNFFEGAFDYFEGKIELSNN